MRLRLASFSLLLLTVLATPGTPQATGRIFCVVVDDIRFLRADVESAERLLAVLRDEVFTAGDKFGLVSTGPSSVAVDLRDARDRASFNEAIRRVVNAASVLAGATSEPPTDAARLRRHAHVALATTASFVRHVGNLKNRHKYVLVLTSGATSAASLEAMLDARGASTVGAGGAAASIGPAELRQQLSEIAATAKESDVRIRVVDPQDPASADVLRALK